MMVISQPSHFETNDPLLVFDSCQNFAWCFIRCNTTLMRLTPVLAEPTHPVVPVGVWIIDFLWNATVGGQGHKVALIAD